MTLGKIDGARIAQGAPMMPLPTAAVPEWMGDDRVTCADCAWKSREMCRAKRTTHVPIELRHYCDDYRRANGKG